MQLTRGKVTPDEKLPSESPLFGFKAVHVGQSWIAASEQQSRVKQYGFRESNVLNDRDIIFTVNSLYSGHYRDLKLVSSLARARNSGSKFQSNVCLGFSCCPFYRSVRCRELSARRELTAVYGRYIKRSSVIINLWRARKVPLHDSKAMFTLIPTGMNIIYTG